MQWFLKGQAYREAIARIERDKGSPDGLLFRLIWRRFSIPLGRVLVQKYPRVSPNALTVATMLLGLGAAILWASAAAHPWCLLGGAVLLLMSNFGDGLDGDVARALKHQRRQSAKRWGMFLDTMCDRTVDAALIVAFGLYLCAAGLDRAHLVILVGIALVSTLISTFSRHAVREAYAPLAQKQPYTSGAIHAAGRGLRLLIMTLGAFSEFVHRIAGGELGTVVIGTLALLSGLQVFQMLFRAYELRQNLRKISAEEP